MPLYTYQCDNCGVRFEKLQKFSDKPIKLCPECNKSAVKRVIQPAGIIFKGSGWYKTDSRSTSSSPSPSSSSSDSPGKGKKADSKSDSKSESKSESASSNKTSSPSDDG
jgi:putative FmdB family regulatory protein